MQEQSTRESDIASIETGTFGPWANTEEKVWELLEPKQKGTQGVKETHDEEPGELAHDCLS